MPTPYLCLPFATAASTITITYSAGGPDTINLAAQAATYNDRSTDAARDFGSYVVQELNAQGTVGTWTQAEAPGVLLGKYDLTCTAAATVTGFAFSDLATAQALGFDSVTPTLSAGGGATNVKAARCRAWLWVPYGASVSPLDEDTLTRRHVVLETAPPVFGDRTVDLYYSGRAGDLRLADLYACNVLEHYEAQAGYLARVIGATSSRGTHFCWEAFAYAWLTSSAQTARYFGDADDPDTYTTVQAAAGALADAGAVLTRSSPAPLIYNFNLPLWAA